MAEVPERVSPLAGTQTTGGATPVGGNGAGVTIEERVGLAIVQLEVRDPGHLGLAAVWNRIGIEVAPAANRAATLPTHTVLWTGLGRWLLVTEERTGESMDLWLREEIGDGAAAIDLGHARTVLRLSGHATGKVLAKGCPVDIESMGGDACCASLIAHSAVIIHRLGEGDGFDVYITRSYARSLWEWLHDAALEYREG